MRMPVVAMALVAGGLAHAQALRPRSPDQPTKASSPGTVDAGHFQVEATPADWIAGQGTAIGATTLKYGVTDFADVEVAVAPCAVAWGCPWGGAAVRAKVALLPEDGALTAAVIPGVIVNPGGLVQGTLAAPLAYRINSTVGLDATATVIGPSEATFQFAAGANIALSQSVTFSIEGWVSTGWVRGETGDIALAWQPTANDQWSIGGNFGVPTAEVYFGYVRRF